MSRYLSWQTIVPRLLLVVVILLGVQYGLSRAVRSIAVRSGEGLLGAQVELAHAHVRLLDRQVLFTDLRCENPHRPTQNLVHADRLVLDVRAAPLFRKQAVIDHGTVIGLRFGTPRQASDGAADAGQGDSSSNWFSDAAGERAREWLDQLDDRFEQDLVRQLESVTRAEALCARWPDQAVERDRRVRELKQRADELQQTASAAETNPLRHVEVLDALPQRVAALRQEFQRVDAELDTMLDSLESDRRAIIALRQHDEQFLRDRLQLDAVDANALTAYLLRDAVAKPLDELIGWLRWIRQVAPAEPAPRPRPTRGEEVLFAGCRPAPPLLIRSLDLRGNSRVGGQPVELRGVLTDFSNAPALHARPMQLRLQGAGSLPIELQATIDRTGPTARDEVLADCSGILLPKLDFGRSNQLSLSVAPSVASLSISVLVHGEKLTGDLQLVQNKVQLVPVLNGTLSDVPLAAALTDTLAGVNSLAIRVALSGTLDDPQCALWSNLGPALAEAMEQALRRAGDDHARALMARAQRHVDERLAGLERQVCEHHAELAAQLTSATGQLERIASQQTTRARLSHEQLGRRLPANSLFR